MLVADNNPGATQAGNAQALASSPNLLGGTSVPTKAPSAPSPTPPSNPAQPTTVINSGTAASYTNNTLVPALQSAQQGLTDQNAKNTSNTFGLGDGSQYDASGKQITPPGGQQTPPATQTPTPPEQTPGTAEHALLNTPEAGYHFEYAPDGTRTQVVNGTNQPGYSPTPPPTPVTGSNGVTQSNGTTIKQMSDGSYAAYDALGNYQGPANQQQYQDAQTANQLSQNIMQLANGSYPLTSTEQAQVTAVQQSFQSLIKEQEIANANLTGGTTVAMNLYGMGNSVAGLGDIKGTIDSGIAKIADINSKMVKAVADMEQSFREKDMAAMKTAYDVLTGAQKDRQAAIDKLNSDAEAKAKDMRDYNEKVKVDAQNEAHQQFQDQISQANLTLAQKKQIFDQYMAGEDLTLKKSDLTLRQDEFKQKQKVDAVDMWYKQQEIGLRRQAQSPTAPGNIPTVQLNGRGLPTAAGQRQFLSQLPPDVATMVKGLADYSINPADYATRLAKGAKGLTRSDAVALVKQYDPTYDDSQWQSRQKLRTDFTSGKYSQNITSLNTAAAHLTDLEKAFAALNNKSGVASIINKPVNSLRSLFGSGSVNSADTNLKAAIDEMATAFKSSGATDAEIKGWQSSINRNASKDQSKAFINKAIQLLGDRLNNLDQTYQQGMGKPSTNGFLHDSVAAQLLDLKSKGYNVDVPALQENPTVRLSTAVQQNPTLKDTVNQIRQIAPNITPDELVQQLNLQ